MSSELLPVLALVVVGALLLVLYRPAIVAVLFGLTLPLGSIDLPGGLSFVIFMSGVVIGVGLVARLQRGLLPLPKTVASFSAIVWSLGILVGILVSPSIMASAPFGMWQIISALMAVYWAELAGRPTLFEPALMATLIGFGIVATSGIVMSSGSLAAEYGGAVVSGRRTGVFAQPNEYGLFCMVALIFTLGLVATTDRWLRAVSALVCALSGLGLMLSLSRGSWVGAVGGIALLAYLLPQIRKGLVVAAAAMVAVGGMVVVSPVQVPFLSVFVDRALTIGEERTNPFDERTAYRAEGLREWNDSPWIGQGPNSFPQLSDQIDSYARPGGAEHPHRLLLTIGAEQGVVGLLAMFGFTVAIVLAVRFARPGVMASYRLRQEERRDDDQPRDAGLVGSLQTSLPAVVVLCGAAALGGVFVEGIADFAMRNPLSRSVVFLVFGWVLAGERLLRWQRWQRWQMAAGDRNTPPAAERQPASG